MYISHKNNVIQQIDEVEWNCRRKTKGLDKPEYWTWLDSVTTDGVVDYSGETGYTIVECTDENVQARLDQLSDYISISPLKRTYNIKYYASKRDAEEILDLDGKSHDPKQYVSSHFVPDDSAKDKRILDQKWADIRTRRNRELTESDWVVVKAKEEHPNASIPSDWVDYRTELRDITKQSDPDDITWPTKPS
tara:strand:+ start:2610 stop:3185 length:576 start_codon:yes stop_codon:yes gene_type:complete